MNDEQRLLDEEEDWEYDSSYQGFCMKVVSIRFVTSIKENKSIEKFIYEIYKPEFIQGKYNKHILIESSIGKYMFDSEDECRDATQKFMDSPEFRNKWMSDVMIKVRCPRRVKKNIKKEYLDCNGYLPKRLYKQLRIKTFEYKDKSDGISYLHEIDDSNLNFKT